MATNEKVGENPLHISWFDSALIPVLNRGNVLKYFSERSNSFYDVTCNNEFIKMQGLSPDHLLNLTGIEYSLHYCQEPILYIIRKQKRHSPTQVETLADYYIIAGTVYQAPDVKSIVNSRLTSALHHIESAFSEVRLASRYHPSKGYWWQFGEETKADGKRKKRKKKTEETGSSFQCIRTDKLLENLAAKFPHKFYQEQVGGPPIPIQSSAIKNEEANQPSVFPQQAASSNIRENPTQMQPASQIRIQAETREDVRQMPEKRAKYM